MKKVATLFLAVLISLSITGCSLLLKEEKKEEAKPVPKQEKVQQTEPQQQDQNPVNADSVLADSKPLEVDLMTIYVDDRTWTPQPQNDGSYYLFPDSSSFEQSFEMIMVKADENPFPRLDKNAADIFVKSALESALSDFDDKKFETLKLESNEIVVRFQIKESGLIGEGFFRIFGNNQKSGIVMYLNMKNTSEEEMEKWQKRVEAAKFADTL